VAKSIIGTLRHYTFVDSRADAVTTWMAALENRHLADFRVQEVTRALRAVSSAYIERRSAARGVLDTTGKRAAFALFYAPLHLLAVRHVVVALGAATPPPGTIVDVGCGTGAVGAAWALAAGGAPRVTGIDRHPWATAEARWTYHALGIEGRAHVGRAERRLPAVGAGDAVVAGWVLNEMDADARVALEARLFDAAARGVRVLVVEPIARRITPWWDATAARVREAGGRDDDWKFPIDLPERLRQLDGAAGLDHRVLSCRTLYLPGG
jgi:SAM-dependent methyltransferase